MMATADTISFYSAHAAKTENYPEKYHCRAFSEYSGKSGPVVSEFRCTDSKFFWKYQ